MIALVLVAFSIVWVVVNNIINRNIEKTESCGLETLGKINFIIMRY